jgi:hypothetical protein
VLDRARAGEKDLADFEKLPPKDSPLFVNPRSDAATCP